MKVDKRETETYRKIIEYIQEKPRFQGEIQEWLPFTLNTVKKHLQRAIKNKEVIFVSNNRFCKMFIKKVRKIWKPYVHQYYFPTPMSGELYTKLIERYSNKDKNKKLINEIVDLYKLIEFGAKIQELYFSDRKLIKRTFKSKGRDYSDKIIDKKIERAKKDVKLFYKKRKQWIIRKIPFPEMTIQGERHANIYGSLVRLEELNNLNNFLDIIKMTPLMHWKAYFHAKNEKHLEKSTKNLTTTPMINKMVQLFSRVVKDYNNLYKL